MPQLSFSDPPHGCVRIACLHTRWVIGSLLKPDVRCIRRKQRVVCRLAWRNRSLACCPQSCRCLCLIVPLGNRFRYLQTTI